MMRALLSLAAMAAIAGSLVLSGCETLDAVSQGAAAAAAATGVVTPQQAQSIAKVGSAVAKSFSDITPEQEYYIGRTVAAMVLDKYPAYDQARVTQYLNELGQALAQDSEQPETFGGYHFLAVDTDDINAFAAPGGLIVVSRGLLRCCPTEDAVAAVLAHEIGHVAHKDGLRQIKQGCITTALTVGITEAGKQLAGQELAQVTEAFEGSISDITHVLIDNGYSRDLEYQADQSAVALLKRIGYDPNGLKVMLEEMQKRLKPGGHDFAKTHPSPADRIAKLQKALTGFAPKPEPPARQERFRKALAGI